MHEQLNQYLHQDTNQDKYLGYDSNKTGERALDDSWEDLGGVIDGRGWEKHEHTDPADKEQ